MDLPQDPVEEFLSRIDVGCQESASLVRGVTVLGKRTPSEWSGPRDSKSEGTIWGYCQGGFVSLCEPNWLNKKAVFPKENGLKVGCGARI